MKNRIVILLLCVCGLVNASETDTIYLSNKNFSNFLSDFGSTDYPDSGYYKVTEDIDTVWSKVLGGTYSYETYSTEHNFKGTFDGVGHTIDVTRSGVQTGLFEVVAASGVVRNLRITGDMTTDGSKNQAFIAMHNFGTIENIVIYGNLYGIEHSPGSIASENSGTILNCAFHGYVQGSGAAYCSNWYGGLIGLNEGTLKNSIYIGHVFQDLTLSDDKIGGALVGTNGSSNITSTFYNTDSCYHAIGINNATLPNLSYFGQQADSLMSLGFLQRAGWDITDEAEGSSVWYMEDDGTTYPYLRFEMAGPVTVTDVTGGTVEVSPSHKLYLKGATATVTIDLNFGYQLTGWLVNDSLIKKTELSLTINKAYNITPVLIYSMGISNALSSKVNIYPNPVTASATVEGLSTLSSSKALLTIYGVSGNLIMQQEVSESNNSVDLSRLSSGIYIAKISCQEGNKQIKLIKE